MRRQIDIDIEGGRACEESEPEGVRERASYDMMKI